LLNYEAGVEAGLKAEEAPEIGAVSIDGHGPVYGETSKLRDTP
jgi:hypothetical protein